MKKSTKYMIWAAVLFVGCYINGALAAHSDGQHSFYTNFYGIMAGLLGFTSATVFIAALTLKDKNK